MEDRAEDLYLSNPTPASIFGGLDPGEGAQWGNQALSAGVWGEVGDMRVELRAATSRYVAELPAGDSIPIFATGENLRDRITADVSTPWGGGFLRFGASLDRHASTYQAVRLDTVRAGDPSRAKVDGVAGGAYLEGGRPLGSQLSLRGGIRLDRFTGDDGIRLAPRVTLSWSLTDAAVLTLAAGRYHQFSNFTAREVEENLEGNETDTFRDDLPPLDLVVRSANHLVVSLDQALSPELRLGLEGFVKNFHGVAGAGVRDMNASGVDLRVAREGERASGWLGYTMTWFWAPGGTSYDSDDFSGRHLLSAGLSTRLTDRTGLRIRASFGDGLPYTTIPLASEDAAPVGEVPASDRDSDEPTFESVGNNVLNQTPNLAVGPDEGFLRVEAELFGHWTSTMGGRPWEIRPYLRVLNALNRRDALFYHFDPWKSGGPEPLAELPLLPLLGIELRF